MAFTKIPVTSVRSRRLWRCVPNRFIDTALESGPSFTKDRRYSIQGEFGAVYFSGSPNLAELEAMAHGGEDREPVSYLAYELTITKLVDLTSKEVCAILRLNREDLLRSRSTKDRYEVTQQLARAVYSKRLNGIIAPSIHDPHGEKPDWFNVALYPAHLMQSCLRLVKTSS